MEVYRHLSSMEPLLPQQRRAELSVLSAELLRKIGRLSGQVHSPLVRSRLAMLLRWMNCYYSNLIEGHKTEPRAIESALRADYADDPVKRDNQRLSQAHVEVEGLIESPGPKSQLRIAFPTKVLEGYFPKLYLDLD